MSNIENGAFIPTAPSFKELVLLNMQQLTNFPYIEKDFDAITDYELLCKVVDYLNQVIANNNTQNETVTNLYNGFLEIYNYFNTLDVQDEINNKLNAMAISGELANIINQDIFTDINSQILQNTVDIHSNTEELETTIKENQADSITMTMLTQEVRTALTGGSTAVVGEDSVGMVNIKDGAITIYKLDDYLQSTKSISYGDAKDLGERYAGFVTDNDGVLSIQTADSNYAHLRYELTKGKIYSFTGLNYYLGYGIIVCDSSDNIIYKSGTAVSNEIQPESLIFRVNEDNLTAYFTIFKNLYDSSSYVGVFARYNTPILREIEIFTNNYIKIEPRLIKTYENYFLGIGHDGFGQPRPYSYNGANFSIYEIVKGKKYKLQAWDWYSACGIYLLDLNNDIIYQSTDTSVGNTYVEKTYIFTAQEDGYVCLFERGQYVGTVEIIEDLIGNQPVEYTERLGFNKWYALGDSLTEVNFRSSKNYVGYITEELGITSVNLGHSSAGYMHTANNHNFRTEIDEIVGYDYENDIITIMGSINDFQHMSDLGQIGDTGTDTLYGCMYTFCNDLFTKYIGARIGIITPPPTNIYHSNYQTFVNYNTALKETAKLFSIPVLDLSEKSNLKPWIQNFQTEFFTADGAGASGQSDQVHPNSKGHWLLHNEIKEFLKTL